jgi:hypothetical protein
MLRVSSIQVSQTSPLPFHAEARKWLRADSHLGPPQWGLFDWAFAEGRIYSKLSN